MYIHSLSQDGPINVKGIPVILYELTLEDGSTFFNSVAVNGLKKFKAESDEIGANRFDAEALRNGVKKVYTRVCSGGIRIK